MSEKWKHRWRRAATLGLVVLIGATYLLAGELKIRDSGQGKGRIELRFQNKEGTNGYVLIWCSEKSPAGPWKPLAAAWGREGAQEWTDREAGEEVEQRYYRVISRSLADAAELDSDGDGMDDLYELRHPCLDPVADDGQDDADRDGIRNLDEYLAEKARGFPKIVLDAVVAPEFFSPVLTSLVFRAQYRVRPTDGLVGASHGNNDKNFFVRQMVDIRDSSGTVVRTLRQDFPIDTAGISNAEEYVMLSFSVSWDGKDGMGRTLTDGAYTCHVNGIYLRVNESGGGSAKEKEKQIASSETLVRGCILDATPPAILSFSPGDGESTDNPFQPLAVVYADAPSGVATGSVGLIFDTADVTAVAQVTATGAVYAPAEALSEGEHSVLISLCDMAGNVVTGGMVFVVEQADKDLDGLPDRWEAEYFGDLSQTPEDDPDLDGFANVEEYVAGTDPTNPESSPVGGLYVSDDRGDDANVGSYVAPFQTIARGIAAATNGNRVVVLPGVYKGSLNRELDFGGKAIMVMGAGGADATVLDCERGGIGFRFQSGEGADSVLAGLTVRNGHGVWGQEEWGQGGAVYCKNSSPLIRRCKFVENDSKSAGAVVFYVSSAVISECEVAMNRGSYGALFWVDSPSAVIENCVIVANAEKGGGSVGGVLLVGVSNALVRNCMIAGNIASRFGVGGIALYESACRILNCTVVDNEPRGILCWASGHDSEVHNTILWGNSETQIGVEVGNAPDVGFCAVQGGWTNGTDIIEDDPLLEAPFYRLSRFSPCIDAGSAEDAPATDRDGQARWDDPDRPNVMSPVEIGADEFVDADRDGLSDNYTGVSSDPQFSRERGFHDAPFVLTITGATENAVIYYSVNGCIPTIGRGSSGISPVSVPIDRTTVLRALVCEEGKKPSSAVSHSYIFPADVVRQPASPAGMPGTWGEGATLVQADYGMDSRIVDGAEYSGLITNSLKTIPTLSISLNPWDLFGKTGLYDKDTDDGYERAASMELIYPDGRKGTQINCALRPHSVFWESQLTGTGKDVVNLKRSFRVYFKEEYGPTRLTYPLFESAPLNAGSAAGRFKRFVLRAGSQRNYAGRRQIDQTWTTYTRDQWGRDTEIEMSGAGARGTFVHLYLNGMYWGLYNPCERPDAHFLAEYFGGKQGDWYSGKSDGDLSGDESRREYLLGDLANTNAVDLADPARYAEAREYLDVAEFCDYILLWFYCGGGDWNDWYFGNRTAPSPTPGMFLTWDMEVSWIPSNLSDDGAWVPPPFLTGSYDPNVNYEVVRLFRALWRNADFRQLFADRLHTHTAEGGALSSERSQARWMALCDFIDDAMIAESARWGDAKAPYAGGVNLIDRNDHWYKARNYVFQQMDGNETRLRTILRTTALCGYPMYPAIDPPEIVPGAGVMELTNDSGAIYYTLDGDDPRAAGGDVSPSATLYEGPIAAVDGLTVSARALSLGVWSALAAGEYAPAPAPIRISEIMYKPSGEDDVFVKDLGNSPPAVSAGKSQLTVLGDEARVRGRIADDGLPETPGRTTGNWNQIGGPATVVFSDPEALESGVTAPMQGAYGLLFSGSDGQRTRTASNVLVVVGEPDPAQVCLWLQSGALVSTNAAGGVSVWGDRSVHERNATQPDEARMPLYARDAYRGHDGVVFDGLDDILTVVGGFAASTGKVVALAFQAGDDIERRQVVYEEGDSESGLNICVENGRVWMSAWDTTNAWGPVGVSKEVGRGMVCVVGLEYDAAAGRLSGYMNGAKIGDAAVGLFTGSGEGVSLGGIAGNTRFADGSVGNEGECCFGGTIYEAIDPMDLPAPLGPSSVVYLLGEFLPEIMAALGIEGVPSPLPAWWNPSAPPAVTITMSDYVCVGGPAVEAKATLVSAPGMPPGGTLLVRFAIEPAANAKFVPSTPVFKTMALGEEYSLTMVTGLVASAALNDTKIVPTFGASTTIQTPKSFTVVEMVSVEWVEMDSPLSTNPNPGGGKRMFPDKQTPTDTTDRKKVKVRATISPKIKDVDIYYKAFDVDDPSTNAAPIDDEANATDNRGGLTPLPAPPVKTDAAGKAEAEFTVSMKPGDNFRVVAACEADYLTGLTAKQNDGVQARVVDATGDPVPENKVTELLTVWRRLNYELDSMGTLPFSGAQANHLDAYLKFYDCGVEGGDLHPYRIDVFANSETIAHMDDGSPSLPLPSPGIGRFEHGVLYVGSGASVFNFPIYGNGATYFMLDTTATPLPEMMDATLVKPDGTSVSRKIAYLECNYPGGMNFTFLLAFEPNFAEDLDSVEVGGIGVVVDSHWTDSGTGREEYWCHSLERIPLRAYDDDLLCAGDDVPDIENLTWLEHQIKKAYVAIGDAVGEKDDDYPFMRNGWGGTDKWQSKDQNQDDYWVFYALACFQAGTLEDMDPRDPDTELETGLGGMTLGAAAVGDLYMFYEIYCEVEPIDPVAAMAIDVAHEVSHLFGTEDLFDPATGKRIEPEVDSQYTPLTIHLIRSCSAGRPYH